MNKELSLTQTQDFIAAVRQTLLDSSLIAQTDKFLYDIKLIKCGNYIQIYKYEEKHMKKNDSLSPLKEKRPLLAKINNKTNLKEKENIIRTDNIFRSKLSLQRLAKANIESFQTFITLTFAENVTNIKEANKTFNTWRTQIKKEFSDFKYICVPEFQKRGAVHYHLITNLFLNNKLIILQENKKNCYDVKFWKHGFSSVYSLNGINAVAYISKYLTKNIDNRLFSHKRYFYSKNLIIPKVEYLIYNDNKSLDYIQDLIKTKVLCFSNSYKVEYTKEKIKFYEFTTN